MNKTIRYIALILAAIVCLFSCTACSSKKGDGLQMFSSGHSEEYINAAKKHFSNVGWSNANYTDGALEYSHGAVSAKIGGIDDDTRYLVVISEDEGILTSEPIDGKRYSVFVYDNGRDDIKISIHYCVGTTENCVVKGNVVSGEFAYNNSLNIKASEVSDPTERAVFIFNALHEALVDIEGK